jgi:hypothetical protein
MNEDVIIKQKGEGNTKVNLYRQKIESKTKNWVKGQITMIVQQEVGIKVNTHTM